MLRQNRNKIMTANVFFVTFYVKDVVNERGDAFVVKLFHNILYLRLSRQLHHHPVESL